jgi:hypothetical protein
VISEWSKTVPGSLRELSTTSDRFGAEHPAKRKPYAQAYQRIKKSIHGEVSMSRNALIIIDMLNDFSIRRVPCIAERKAGDYRFHPGKA